MFSWDGLLMEFNLKKKKSWQSTEVICSWCNYCSVITSLPISSFCLMGRGGEVFHFSARRPCLQTSPAFSLQLPIPEYLLCPPGPQQWGCDVCTDGSLVAEEPLSSIGVALIAQSEAAAPSKLGFCSLTQSSNHHFVCLNQHLARTCTPSSWSSFLPPSQP